METSYKEKYEQAIERLKQWDREHPCAGYVLSDRDKFIFPELAESEDKKITEGIIELVKQSSEILNKKNQERMLAWLERQAEPKTEENKGNVGGISPTWSEEDEQYVEDTLALIGFGFSAHTIGEVQKWLHSLQDRVQPQHKQEWSEEDENHVKSILSTIECCKAQFPNAQAVVEAYNADIEWLKSLRPQSRWKPSETDITILEKVIKGELEPKIFQATLCGIFEQLKKLKDE